MKRRVQPPRRDLGSVCVEDVDSMKRRVQHVVEEEEEGVGIQQFHEERSDFREGCSVIAASNDEMLRRIKELLR